MVIYVKDKKLKARVFKTIKRYDTLALKHYAKGRMREGSKYETKSDKVYKKNYSKIFGRR